MDHGTLAQNLPISSLISEFDSKMSKIKEVIDSFDQSIRDLSSACTVRGSYGNGAVSSIHSPHQSQLEKCLRISAWRYLYQEKNLSLLMTASERARFERDLENPPDFNMDTIRATFGDLVSNPRMSILKGLAEVFCQLDDAYKSHSNVKIGVKGLPKRVILTGWNGYYRMDEPVNLINALRLAQGKGPITRDDLKWNVKGCPENEQWYLPFGKKEGDEVERIKLNGLEFRAFQNGNLHIRFDKDTLTDINRALAEYYGEVLPDVESDDSDVPPILRGTSVSKDLQYYWTPRPAGIRLLDDVYLKDKKILEPSCGDGRIMDLVVERAINDGHQFKMIGYEYHNGRAQEAREKGHSVITANFLEVPATDEFDVVLMNPPFYGKHYLKHINHAIKFLKPGGLLRAILPATAWYDHGMLPKTSTRHYMMWRDLPVGTFAESGTNVPTGVWSYIKPTTD